MCKLIKEVKTMLTRPNKISVYFTDDEKKRFQDFAKSQGRSLTAQLRVSIEKDIKNTENNK